MNQTGQHDERAGLPSASSMDRLAHCAGSRAAEEGLPELPDSDVTRTGNRVHTAMETGEDEDLNLTEAEIAARLRDMEARETENWMRHFNLEGVPRAIREKRCWIRDRDLNPIASAKPDVAYQIGNHGLVWNYKSGFARPPGSDVSWQSRTEVVAVWHEFFNENVDVIRGGFLASRLSSHFDYTDYTLSDVKRIDHEIRHIIWRSQQPNAQRTPGPHCRWCRAQGVCREAATYSLVVTHQMPVDKKGNPDQLAIIEAVAQMTPEELKFVHEREALARVVFESVKRRLITLPEADLQRIGYTVAPGSNLKEITDAALAFTRLSTVLSDEERAQCIKITRGKAAELLASRKGISKSAAQAEVDQAIGDAMVEKKGSPRLRAL